MFTHYHKWHYIKICTSNSSTSIASYKLIYYYLHMLLVFSKLLGLRKRLQLVSLLFFSLANLVTTLARYLLLLLSSSKFFLDSIHYSGLIMSQSTITPLLTVLIALTTVLPCKNFDNG